MLAILEGLAGQKASGGAASKAGWPMPERGEASLACAHQQAGPHWIASFKASQSDVNTCRWWRWMPLFLMAGLLSEPGTQLAWLLQTPGS